MPEDAMSDQAQDRAALAQSEVRAAIAFYGLRGWCWLQVVEFICWKARQS